MKSNNTLYGAARAAAAVILCMILFMTFSCAGDPETIPSDLAPIEFFQQGQDAANRERWDLAIRYYEAFLEAYPEDLARGIEAEYEIAFIHYKKGDDQEAARLFEALLEKYRTDAASSYPQWPRVLAARVLDNIREE
jgi:outer membrane protein assembly factor BamD (BamD/ComL family)